MGHKTPVGYEHKFAGLIELCEKTKASGVDKVIIAEPWVLGDNYEEVIESLTRIAKAGLSLQIVNSEDFWKKN